MFTVEQREALRERVLRLAENDERVVAGALVGSLALDGGDRYSDIDLTFGLAGGVPIVDVLDDFTRALVADLDAVHLVDLDRGSAVYRVFLFPETLQLDLSMRPASEFRPGGPRFRLLFGSTVADDAEPAATGSLFIATPATAQDMFGWGVVYALHARACIERARVWQAEHYIGAVRDHALSLACLREGVTVPQARGFDDVSAETLTRFEGSLVKALDRDALRTALTASTSALLREGKDAELPNAAAVARHLAGFP